MPRRGAAERLLAWIVTGPIGRLLAFFADLAVYWWRAVRRRKPERGSR